MSVKDVYLDVAGRMHSLYEELILNPPSGYRFIKAGSSWDKISRVVAGVGAAYSLQQRVLNEMFPVNLAKAYLERFKKPPKGTDLTYAAGHLVFRKEPWVVDFEFVTQLAGYSIKHFKRYRRIIERTLSSEHCRGIICWTDAGKKTALSNLDCQGFANKVDVVPLAVHKKSFVKEYGDKGRVKLLFVGSANILGEFEYKGGNEVIEAFLILREKYPDLQLVIRSDMPQESKIKCKKLRNVKIIEGIIPREQLEQEFVSADIFLFPSHSTPGLAILEAMSFGLPVITTDVWANPEMVQNEKTGFVIERAKRVPYYTENFIPNWNYHSSSRFMRAVRATDPTVVEELVEKTSILIEDEELRRRMGKAGRQEIETGRFSLEKRNQKLKEIFDKAT